MRVWSRIGVSLAVIVFGCTTMTMAKNTEAEAKSKTATHITKGSFGKTPEGVEIESYTLQNANGASATIITFGATLTKLMVPDRSGKMEDVVLGFDNLSDYAKKGPYFGATIGRYGNRIAKGHFTLDGKEYQLATNNGPNSLHGGLGGFDHAIWKAEPKETTVGPSVKFTYVSKDGEDNYPGTLTVSVTYTLTNKNELELDYAAETDKATVLNITNHSYFNLAGSGDVLKHVLYLNADKFTAVDDTLIPTGELKSVAGTPLDFRKPTTIGARIAEIKDIGGYDHNYVLNGKAGTLREIAKVEEPTSGRQMTVWTTEPGVQFYSAIHLNETIVGKGGTKYQKYGALCLETQHYPDSPNHPDFPSTVLRPGAKFTSETIYKFSAK
jgi:aldose 1-epimerase